jgi:CRP/FNR family transcriptional regulator, nitrogen fixation regulation protein
MASIAAGKSIVSDAFGDKRALRQALLALQRGPISFQRNNIIACEGDAVDYIFVVVSGVLRSCKTFQNGDRKVIAFYLPGDLFGWDDEESSFSVEAASDAVVMFIKRSGLMVLAGTENHVANILLATTMTELRRSQEHALLVSRTAKCRVATFLTDLSKRLGCKESIDLPMSHQDIADYLGLTIETLSRAITDLERSGVLVRSSSHRKLLVQNRALLANATS